MKHFAKLVKALARLLFPDPQPGGRLHPDGGPEPFHGPYPWELPASPIGARGWPCGRPGPWCNFRPELVSIHACELAPDHGCTHLCRCGYSWSDCADQLLAG